MSEAMKTQFRAEGEPAFPIAESEEKDNSTDSSSGEKTNQDSTESQDQDKKPADDKNEDGKNFADHPRWKEREDDWTKRFNEQEKRHTEELDKIRQDIETKFTKKREDLADQDVPAWFGGDADQWAQYKAHEDARLAEAEERAIKRVEEKTQKEQTAIKEATDYFNETVTTIESDKAINPDGIKVDKNKLLKFTLDNDLVDSKGRWNYRAAFQLMQGKVSTQKNDAIKEKKDIAGASVDGNHRGEDKAPNFATSEDFSKPGAKPW